MSCIRLIYDSYFAELLNIGIHGLDSTTNELFHWCFLVGFGSIFYWRARKRVANLLHPKVSIEENGKNIVKIPLEHPDLKKFKENGITYLSFPLGQPYDNHGFVENENDNICDTKFCDINSTLTVECETNTKKCTVAKILAKDVKQA